MVGTDTFQLPREPYTVCDECYNEVSRTSAIRCPSKKCDFFVCDNCTHFCEEDQY